MLHRKIQKSASVQSSPDIQTYNRRKSVSACARQDLPPDRIGEEEDDQISVTPLPNCCGTFEVTRSISMVSKPFVFEVFVVKSAQKVTLSIIVLTCVTINGLWMI